MHVLLMNGSPHPAGCTYTALSHVEKGLALGGVESKYYQLGNHPVRGCIACKKCDTLGHCVFEDDIANDLLRAMQAASGIVIGSPVYYAGPNGALCAVLDRVFYSSGNIWQGKPGAAVVSCRRGGSTASLDRLLKYFTISSMPVATSQYWPMVHGHTPADVLQDAEGLQTMRALGRNMAELVKRFVQDGPPPSLDEPHARTNFIR